MQCEHRGEPTGVGPPRTFRRVGKRSVGAVMPGGRIDVVPAPLVAPVVLIEDIEFECLQFNFKLHHDRIFNENKTPQLAAQ